MRKINEIVVHCTATNPSWYEDRSAEDVVAEIRRWHTDPKPKGRGWSDIGYHFVVHRDGSIAPGRPVWRSGAHVAGRNKYTIGVSLVGGRGGCAYDAFEENYTDAQEQALRTLIDDLRKQYPGIKTVSGHNQFAAKACPCFDVEAWY